MPKASQLPNPTGNFSLDRCKALADGVFAIVVTLLVLGIDVPSNHNFSEHGLLLFLDRIGFQLLIYGISFWLAATYWIQHAAIMHYFRRGNRAVIWLNLLFLFPVTMLPFVTALKGAYRSEEMITLLFGVLQILIGLALIALWIYAASNPHLLDRPVGEMLRRKVTRRMLVSPVMVSALAIAVSFLSIRLSTLFFLSIPLYYLSHREIDQNWSDPGTSAD